MDHLGQIPTCDEAALCSIWSILQRGCSNAVVILHSLSSVNGWLPFRTASAAQLPVTVMLAECEALDPTCSCVVPSMKQSRPWKRIARPARSIFPDLLLEHCLVLEVLEGLEAKS